MKPRAPTADLAPKRWLDDAGASSAARDVLRGGLDLEPSPGDKDAIWATLGGVLAGGGAAGGATSGGATAAKGAVTAKSAAVAKGAVTTVAKTAKTAAAGSGILKSMLIGAAAGVVTVGAYSIVVPDPPVPIAVIVAPAPPPSNTVESARAPVAVGTVAPTVEASAEASAEAAPSASADVQASPTANSSAKAPDAVELATPPASDTSDTATQMRAEGLALSDAREAIQKGDFAGALAKLEAFRTKFPTPKLGQELEALSIEALYRGGQKPAAKARAEAFLRAYPTSAHAKRMQAFAE